MRLLLLAALCFAPFASAQDLSFPNKAELDAARQLDPAMVNAESRKFLKAKMKSHGKLMKDLSVAVATLNFKVAQRTAQDMANQPRLDPKAGPAAQLPEGFFAMQNLLRRASQGLADSAKAQNVDATVDQFQFVVTICAACHGVFRAPLAPVPLPGAKPAPTPAPSK